MNEKISELIERKQQDFDNYRGRSDASTYDQDCLFAIGQWIAEVAIQLAALNARLGNRSTNPE